MIAQRSCTKGAHVIPHLYKAQLALKGAFTGGSFKPDCHSALVNAISPKSILSATTHAAGLLVGIAWAVQVGEEACDSIFSHLHKQANSGNAATPQHLELWHFIKDGRDRDKAGARPAFNEFWRRRQQELWDAVEDENNTFAKEDIVRVIRTLRFALCMSSPTASSCESDFGILRAMPKSRTNVSIKTLSDELTFKRRAPDVSDIDAATAFIKRGIRLFSSSDIQRRAPGGGRKKGEPSNEDNVQEVAAHIEKNNVKLFDEDVELMDLEYDEYDSFDDTDTDEKGEEEEEEEEEGDTEGGALPMIDLDTDDTDEKGEEEEEEEESEYEEGEE